MGVRTWWSDWKAHRAGRRPVPNDDPRIRAARDATGATGWATSRVWDEAVQGGDNYARSFDKRVPPSLHISHRDLTRHRRPVPMSERVMEDFGKPRDPNAVAVPNDLRDLRKSPSPEQEQADPPCHSSSEETSLHGE